ncbi:hypothetical protein P3342_009930 [Pyrenophora teres f. teres]|nr:hypothetical protein P3342_009930 [Pyrenophora teres f. teres]
MTSSSVQVTPGLFAANREVAVAYYKGLQSHHANHQFMLGELASHAEKEDKYKTQIKLLKENISSPE